MFPLCELNCLKFTIYLTIDKKCNLSCQDISKNVRWYCKYNSWFIFIKFYIIDYTNRIIIYRQLQTKYYITHIFCIENLVR